MDPLYRIQDRLWSEIGYNPITLECKLRAQMLLTQFYAINYFFSCLNKLLKLAQNICKFRVQLPKLCY